MKTRFRYPLRLRTQQIRSGIGLMLAACLMGYTAQAGNQNWLNTGVTNANWSTGSNWSGGAAPGSTSGLSSDVATFNSAVGSSGFGGSATPIIIDSATQSIGTIQFNNTVGNFTIGTTGGNSLFLGSNGVIQIQSSLTSTNAIETINAPLVIASNNNISLINYSANGSGAKAGTLIIGGQIKGNGGTATLNLTGTNTNANLVCGSIVNGSSSAVSVNKTGVGTWVLGGASTYTGVTTVGAGQLTLDFSQPTAPAANIINNTASSSNLALNGGSLVITGNSGASNSQQFPGTFLGGAASSFINFNQNGASSINLTLGGINRGQQTTIDFSLPTAGAVSTSTTTGVSGIINYATANGGSTWATVSSGTFGALNSYSTGTASYLAANNVDVANGDSVSGVTANSLRFNSAGSTLNLSGMNVVNQGVLVTPTATGTTSITGGTITSGNAGNELTLLNYGGTVNVGSAIVDNGSPTSITIGGSGTTILSGANTFTGNTNLAGGTLSLNGSNLSLASLSGGINSTVALGSGTLTINSGVANNAAYVGAVTGSGAIVKNGAGALILNGVSSTFSGGVVVNNGWLVGQGGSGIGAGTLGALNTITLGDGVSSNSATLQLGGGSNPITVKGGGTGALTFIDATFYQSGVPQTVTLDSTLGLATLTIEDFGYDYLGRSVANGQFSHKGGFAGSGNVLINNNASAIQFYSNSLNNVGSITSMTLGNGVLGSGVNGDVNIANTGANGLGANVTALVQASSVGGKLTYNPTAPAGFTGAIIANAGSIIADLTSSTTGVFSNLSTLTLGGGAFQLKNGTASSNKSQVLNGLTLNPGASTVDANNAGTTTTLDLRGSGSTAAITRNVGGTVDFKASAGTLGASSIIETHQANDATGIIGGYATASGTTWAVNNGSDVVVGLGSASFGILAASTSTTNVDVATGASSATNLAANTLRFNAASSTLTLTGNNVLSDGGILVTPGVGATNTLITGGTLMGASGQDLVVIQNNTNASSTTKIASTIADNGTATALTKSGSGILALTNPANTYTGVTYINSGTLNVAALANVNTPSSIGAGSAAGSAGDLVLNGGVLQYSGSTSTSTNRDYTLTTAGGGFDASGTGSGSLTIGGNMSVSGASSTQGGAQIFQLSGSGTGGAGGVIAGTINNGAGNNDYTTLTKLGAGTWTLSGSNTYTGFTTISAGTLVAANPSALGNLNGTNVVNPALVLLGSGSLDLATDTSINPYNVVLTNSATILTDKATAGSAGITQTLGNLTMGANTLTVNAGANVTGGTPLVAFGAINLTNSSTSNSSILANTANITLGSVSGLNTAGNTTTLNLQNNTSGTSSILGSITNGASGGAVAVTRSNGNTGTWVLAGTNSYTGATTISNGLLNIQNNSALGTGYGMSSSGVTVSSGAGLQIQGGISTTTAVSLSLNGSGVGSKGALESVSGNNTYSGLITLASAATIGSDNAGDTLTLSNTGTITGYSFGLTLTGAGNINVASSIGTATGGLTYNGTGTLTLSGSNTFTGALAINSGTLDLANQYAIQNSTVTKSSAFGLVFDSSVASHAFNLGGLAATTNGAGYDLALQDNASNPVALTVGGNNASTTYAGILSGAGSLTKVGTGTLILSASNTFSGMTTISAGTLKIGNGGTVGSLSGPVTLSSGATLNYNRTDSSAPIGGALTGAGGGLTVSSGTLTLNSTNLPAGSTNTFGTLNVTGTTRLVLAGDSASTNTFSGFNNSAIGDKATILVSGGVNTVTSTYWPSNSTGLYVTSGTISFTGGFILPYGGGYGYLGITGGNVGDGGGAFSMARSGVGVMDITAGSLKAPSGGGAVAVGMANGGQTAVINQTGGNIHTSTNGVFAIGNGPGARGELNLSGGTIGSAGTGAYQLAVSYNATAVGIANLNGGVFTAKQVTGANYASASSLNFNGGTLVASGANTTNFWSANQVNGYINSGGATIDDGGYAITIGQGLLAPTGSGVTSLTLSGPLSGYLGAPYVSITGGSGTGATGVATYDYTTGQVTGVTITNPGTGYLPTDTLTVTLQGGGVADNSTAVTANLGANTSGGLTKTGTGTLTLSGTSTYTGATVVAAGKLVVSGSLCASSAVTVGNASNLAASAILGGNGTVGNVTVGAGAGNTGAVLNPHAGSSSTSVGTSLNMGSLTFADGSAHLALQIGRTTAGATSAGDVSDHVFTTGAVNLASGADLQLSLLSTAYALTNNDVLFLVINGGGSVNGAFTSVNGVATNLSEGSWFTFNSQQYEITYQASYASNSFTGGNDIALMAVPEPGTWVMTVGGVGMLLLVQRRRRLNA